MNYHLSPNQKNNLHLNVNANANVNEYGSPGNKNKLSYNNFSSSKELKKNEK